MDSLYLSYTVKHQWVIELPDSWRHGERGGERRRKDLQKFREGCCCLGLKIWKTSLEILLLKLSIVANKPWGVGWGNLLIGDQSQRTLGLSRPSKSKQHGSNSLYSCRDKRIRENSKPQKDQRISSILEVLRGRGLV